MKKVAKILMCGVGALLIFWQVGCGSNAGTGTVSSVTGTTSSMDSAASAVTAIFSGGMSASISVKDEYEDVIESAPLDGCSMVISGEGNREHPEIQDAAWGTPDVYGSLDYLLDVSEADFCTLPDGTENEGSGPDGLGLLATFELNGDIEGNCLNDEGEASVITMKAGSSGVWRETEATEDEVVHNPEIYGSFILSDSSEGDAEMLLDCTIYLDENETAIFADCSDADGETVVQDTSADCSFASE